MQGPYASGPWEEITRLQRARAGAERLGRRAQHTGVVTQRSSVRRKGQMQYNQITERSKATDVSEGEERHRTHSSLCVRRKHRGCFLRPHETCQNVSTHVRPRTTQHGEVFQCGEMFFQMKQRPNIQLGLSDVMLYRLQTPCSRAFSNAKQLSKTVC